MVIGIVCYPTFGGSGVVATELGKALANLGHEIHFITSSQPVRLDVFASNIFYHEVVVNHYSLFKYQPYETALTSKIVEVCKQVKLDILHVHYAIPHASAALFAKSILQTENIHLPIVTTLHGTDITLVGKDASYEPVITHSINQSDAVTSVSESLKSDTYKHFKINREIKVIYNFVCNEKYETTNSICKKQIFAPNGEKVLVHISNFRKVKRIQDIIKSFAIVKQTIPSKLMLIGDGPERHDAEALARELNVMQDIYFIGNIKEVEMALSAADLFMIASEHESFGLAALEAMASKLPVVSTNAGGLPEINIHGITGLLNNIGDYEQMAKNCIEILENDDTYKTYAKNAKQQALKFDLKNIIPDYINLYNSLLQ
jgi:N-acetyl-alpha-D-glucosaminyl L-malate synthase BshA